MVDWWASLATKLQMSAKGRAAMLPSHRGFLRSHKEVADLLTNNLANELTQRTLAAGSQSREIYRCAVWSVVVAAPLLDGEGGPGTSPTILELRWTFSARLMEEDIQLPGREPLFAVAEAWPKLNRFAFCSNILRKLTFELETEVRIVTKFVLVTREQLVDGDQVQDVPIVMHVQRLRANCLAFPSASIPDIPRYSHNLRELCKLHSHCKTWLAKRTVTHLRTFPRLQGPRLNTMYVDLAVTDETVYFLDNFVARSEACRRELTKRKPHFETFKYSHEELLTHLNLGSRMLERDVLIRTFSAKDAVWGNVDCQFKPEEANNLFAFADVIKRKVILRGIKQAEVVVEDYARSTACLTRRRANRFLEGCYTPVPSTDAAQGIRGPDLDVSAPRLHEPNDAVLRRCTEEAYCCLVVASTLPNLRSLAFSPCGVNHARSLESLAGGCLFLEHLDVGSDGGLSCEACHCPLLFTARRFTKLQTATVADLTSFQLCRVVELRHNVDCEDAGKARDCTCSLGKLLHFNRLLTSLTLVAGRGNLGPRFADNPSAVRSLQYLCVLTATRTPERAAEDFFSVLEGSLPQLRSLHAQYLNVRGTVRVRTWLRQWRPD
ncbi:hypothetical protein HPB52_000090 [Rhipicephalus sanguineus]|uniref:Uncharacterized protein n=1 Tax=Rhipicephalus sanguineus TaxID=34632 RepID=A0A9D4PTI3_RHISA|nr:hypothetical protein HPB52_000090 [Rhipicephalus sanguineus]